MSRALSTDWRPSYRFLPPYGWNRSSGGTFWQAGTNKSAKARSAKILIRQGYHAQSCGQRRGGPITQACTERAHLQRVAEMLPDPSEGTRSMRISPTVRSDAGEDFGLPYERGPIEPQEPNQFDGLPFVDDCLFDQTLHDVVQRDGRCGVFHDLRPIWFSNGAETLRVRPHKLARSAFCQSPPNFRISAGGITGKTGRRR